MTAIVSCLKCLAKYNMLKVCGLATKIKKTIYYIAMYSLSDMLM